MPSLESQGTIKERGSRSDKGRMRWTERDLAALRWIGEQYCIHLGQLAVLLSRGATESSRIPGMLGKETVRKLVQRWKRAGLVESASLVLAQPSWVWLTRKGLEQVGLDYRYWEPKAQGLAHLAAVNQVRLWVERQQPEASWRSERQLNRERLFVHSHTQVEHRPDAEVQIGVQRIAIEVERSAKTPDRLAAILYDLARGYDGIWYFCSPATHAPMQRALAQIEPAVRRKFSLVLLT